MPDEKTVPPTGQTGETTGGQTATGQEGQTATANWYDKLPSEYKTNNTVKNSKSIEDYVKWGVNAEKLIGSKVSIPKEGDEKGWNDFYTKLGRPAKVEDYKINRPSDEELQKTGLLYDVESEKQFLTMAHKRGLNQDTVNELIKWNIAREETAYKQAEERRETDKKETLAMLEKKWGKEYPERKAKLDRFVQSTMSEELASSFDESGIGNDARFIEWIYDQIVKQSDNSSPKGGSSTGDTVESIDQQILELRKNPDFNKKYHGSNYKERASADKELSELYKKRTELVGAK